MQSSSSADDVKHCLRRFYCWVTSRPGGWSGYVIAICKVGVNSIFSGTKKAPVDAGAFQELQI